MRVVLDTNILFSALISPHGAPDAIYRAWRAARFEVVTSRMQLDEIRRASRYPKLQAILQPAKVGAMINNLQRAVVLERLTIEVEADDPDDSFLLAMALAGDADYLIAAPACCNAGTSNARGSSCPPCSASRCCDQCRSVF